MRQRWFIVLVVVALITSGCSAITSVLSEKGEKAEKPQTTEKKESSQKKPKHKEQVKIPEELKDFEFPPEGKYAGDRYNWNKVKKELDKIPKDASGDEIRKTFLALAAEDYTPYFKFFETYDTSIIEVSEEPGDLKDIQLPKKKPVNIVILVDSSGSMAGKVSGGVKMDLAKKAVQQFVSQMPKGANVSLYVYGHKGSNSKKDKNRSCKSIEEVYPLGAYKEDRFNQSLSKFKPTGWTPMAAAMEQAKEALQSHKNAENIMYVVSDGVETCDGDPVQVAKELHESNVKAVVNIIGLDLDDEGQKALNAVAKAGGGQYHSVDSDVDLNKYFEKEKSRLYDAWLKWSGNNWNDANNVASQKYDELAKKSSKMYDLAEQEMNRYYKMAEYLKNERGFEFSIVYNGAESPLLDRKLALHNYNFDTKLDLQKTVLNKSLEIKNNVLDKSLEERSKLY